MAESAPLYEEFDLKKQRPVAGETRRFATGEAVFLSPLPVSVGHTPMDLGGSFLDVNEVYLDVGQGNINKLFQVQLMIWGVMCILITCLAIAPLVAGMMTFGDPYGRSFFTHAMWILPVSSLFSLILGGAFVLLGLYVVITSTFKKVGCAHYALIASAAKSVTFRSGAISQSFSLGKKWFLGYRSVPVIPVQV